MKELISIREANQHLSRYVDAIRDGGEIVITRRGKPVAKLIGIKEANGLTEAQKSARNRTLARMQKGYSLGGLAIQRDALHER
jgi:prevent-host-death family protein